MIPFMDSCPGCEAGGLDRGYLLRIVPLVQERLKTLADSPELTGYFFQEEIVYDSGLLVQKGMDADATSRALRSVVEVLGGLKTFDSPSLEGALRQAASDLGLSGRQLFGALRVATTGRTAAPPLFETMEVLGKTRCLNRIESAAESLKAKDDGT
jgi:glutamyl-tRNA synthetase